MRGFISQLARKELSLFMSSIYDLYWWINLTLTPTITEWLYSSFLRTYILISIHFPYINQYFLLPAIFDCWDEEWRRCTKAHVPMHAGAVLLWALVSDWKGSELIVIFKSIDMLNPNYVYVGSQLPGTLAAHDLQIITEEYEKSFEFLIYYIHPK